MGIIFRNNRPYGGEPLPDISTYATMEDFESDVPAPEENHIYIIAGNLYYWNEENQELEKTPNLNGTENNIPIFDDNNGLKNSIFSYATATSRKILAAALQSGDTLTISGSDGTNTASLSLKDSALINASGSTNVGLFGKSSIYMQGSTSGQGARIAMPSGNPSITMMGDSQISMPSGSPAITMMDRAKINMMGGSIQNGMPQLTMQGNSTLAMIGNSNGNPNFTMYDGSSLYMGNSSQAQIKGMTHIDIGNTNTSATHVTGGNNMVRITVKDSAKVDIDHDSQLYMHGGGIIVEQGNAKHELVVYYCVPFDNYSVKPTIEQIRNAQDLVFHATEYGTGIPSLRKIRKISDVTNADFSLKQTSSAVYVMLWNGIRYYYFTETYDKVWEVARGYPPTFNPAGLLLLQGSSWIDMNGGSSIHGHGNAWLDIGGDSHVQFDEHAEITIAGRSHFQMGGYVHGVTSSIAESLEAPIFQMAGDSCICMNTNGVNSPSIMMSGPGGYLLNGRETGPKTTYGPTFITQPTGLVFTTLFNYPQLGKNSSLDAAAVGNVYGINKKDPQIYASLSPTSDIPNFRMTYLIELIKNSSYQLARSDYDSALSIWNQYGKYYDSQNSFSDYVLNEDEDYYYINSNMWEDLEEAVEDNKFVHFEVSQNTVAILENHERGRSYIKIGAGADQYTKIFIQDNSHTEMRQDSILSLRGGTSENSYYNPTTKQYEKYRRGWTDYLYTQPTDGSMLTMSDNSVFVMHGVQDNSNFEATDGTIITPPQNWQEHPTKNENCPLIEVIDDAEIRLYGKISIKANTVNNTTSITFGGTQAEGEVSFTIDELKSLKNLVGSIPTRVVVDPDQATENGLLYFIDEEGE